MHLCFWTQLPCHLSAALSFTGSSMENTQVLPLVGEASIHPTPRLAYFPLRELGSLFSCFFKAKAYTVIIFWVPSSQHL